MNRKIIISEIQLQRIVEGIAEGKKKKKKKKDTTLCARGKSAAKAKFDVYPSSNWFDSKCKVHAAPPPPPATWDASFLH